MQILDLQCDLCLIITSSLKAEWNLLCMKMLLLTLNAFRVKENFFFTY